MVPEFKKGRGVIWSGDGCGIIQGASKEHKRLDSSLPLRLLYAGGEFRRFHNQGAFRLLLLLLFFLCVMHTDALLHQAFTKGNLASVRPFFL